MDIGGQLSQKAIEKSIECGHQEINLISKKKKKKKKKKI